MSIEFTFIETKSDTSVPFFEHSAEFKNYINSTHAKNLVSGSFTPVISENGLIRTVKAVFKNEESVAVFNADNVLTEAAQKSRAYNQAHGIEVVSTLGFPHVRPVQQPQQPQPEEQSGGIVI